MSNETSIAGLEVTESKDYHLLPVGDRARLSLASAKTEADLKAMVAKHATITEIKDKAGREQAHGAAMELMRARTTITTVAKAARDDATKFSKAVIEEETRLAALVEPEEKRLKALRDTWDAEQERIKREAEERERQRLLAIANRINEIKAFGLTSQNCRTSARVQELIAKLEAIEITAEAFAEYLEEAQTEKTAALFGMSVVLKARQESEDEAKRLAEARVEQERVRQEQAERQRQLDEQAAALDRQQKELAAAKTAQAPVEPVQISRPATPAVQTLAPSLPEVLQAVAPPAVVVAMTPVEVKPAKVQRPTDRAIIGALSLHFRVHESTVISWLQELDLTAANEELAREFA
jgi:hypothetical protein